jgi:hypothetical protein
MLNLFQHPPDNQGIPKQTRNDVPPLGTRNDVPPLGT